MGANDTEHGEGGIVSQVRLRLLASLLVLTASPLCWVRSAGASTQHAVQHNVHGTYIGALQYSVDAAHLHPLVVSAQEVCASHLPQLQWSLAANGYRYGYFAQDLSSSLCDGGASYVVSASVGAFIRELDVLYQHQAPWEVGNRTNRGYSCLEMTYGGSWFTCSTHLASRPIDYIYAAAQSNELRTDELGSRPGIARIAAGDFNMRPDQPSGTELWYPSYDEADQTYYPNSNRPTTKPPASALIKIDYIFSDKFWLDPLFGVAEIKCDSQTTGSDHCFYHGYVLFP